MMRLYGLGPTRSLRALWALRELDAEVRAVGKARRMPVPPWTQLRRATGGVPSGGWREAAQERYRSNAI